MIRAALRWLSRHLVGVALAAALAGVGTGVVAVNRWLSDREAAAVEADRLQRRIADLRAEIDVRAEAARVQRAHAERLARAVAERDALLAELNRMEGLDAPLPDPLRDAAGLLWPR